MEIISSHRIHKYELYSSILKGFLCPHLTVHHPCFVSVWSLVGLHLLLGYVGEFFGEFPPARRQFHCCCQQHKVHYESGHQSLTINFQKSLSKTQKEEKI